MEFSALIILNYNGAKDTLECLASLQKSLVLPTFTIVIDNGSQGEEFGEIRKIYPDYIYLETKENLGFAEGSNRGISLALELGAEWILLLNNDTVVAPSFFGHLLESAKNYPKAAALGPKIYFYDDPVTLWYAGGSVHPHTRRCYHIGCGESFENDPKGAPFHTDYICGCALLLRAKALKEIGFFDSRFFLLWEEIDWCYRARSKGWECLVVPEAKIWHKISSSFPEGNRGPTWQYFYFRNRLLFHRKHLPWHKRFSWRYLQEWIDMVRGVVSFKSSSRFRAQNKAALRGIFDYFRMCFGKGSI